jgi:RHH-type rel operon transcriptional repressor/antitoxin RelB
MPASAPKSVPVTVRIPVEVNEKLEKLARSTRRSKSWLAAEAIGSYVATQADYLAAIEEGRKEAREGRLIPHEKVREWLLSWGTDHVLPMPKAE